MNLVEMLATTAFNITTTNHEICELCFIAKPVEDGIIEQAVENPDIKHQCRLCKVVYKRQRAQ